SLQLRIPTCNLVTAIIVVHWSLTLTVLGSRRTGKADMEMIVVVPPGSDLSQPGSVSACLLAKFLLDRRMHEDASYLGIGCGALDKLSVEWRPLIRIDGKRVLQHGFGSHSFPFFERESVVRHWRQPNVNVGPNLVAGMSC